MKGLIIDGIDCAGKTTLANSVKFRLKKYGGYDLKGLEHKTCESQFDRYLYEYATNNRIIFDRSHISEVVFGKLLRNNIPFSNVELKVLNDIINLKYVFVLGIPLYNEFCDRLERNKQIQVIEKEQYHAIVNEFEVAAKNINHIVYASQSIEELNEIVEAIILKLSV